MARNIVNFNDFVNDFYRFITEESLHKYNDDQLVRIAAKRVYRELQLDTFKFVVSSRLTVNQNTKVVELPADYVKYTKIGILTGDCNVVDISLNPNLNIGGDILLDNDSQQLLDADGFPLKAEITDCGTNLDSSNTIPAYGYGYLFNNYTFNGISGRLYGLGGGNNRLGQYRFNNEENRIELNPNFAYEQIILEYISDQSMAANPKIPVECEDAMWSGTRYYLVKDKTNVSLGDKQLARDEWLRAKKRATARRNQPTKDEIVKSIYRNFMLAPKIGDVL